MFNKDDFIAFLKLQLASDKTVECCCVRMIARDIFISKMKKQGEPDRYLVFYNSIDVGVRSFSYMGSRLRLLLDAVRFEYLKHDKHIKVLCINADVTESIEDVYELAALILWYQDKEKISWFEEVENIEY